MKLKQLKIVIATLAILVSLGGNLEAQFKVIDGEKRIVEPQNIEHEKLRPSGNYDIDRSYTGLEPKSIEHFNLIPINNRLTADFYENEKPGLIEGRLKYSAKSLEGKIEEYLNAATGFLKIDNPAAHFEIEKTWKDDLGFTHVTLNQQMDGYKIYGAQIIMHADKAGIYMLNGEYLTDVEQENATIDFVIDEESLKEIVIANLKNYNTQLLQHKNIALFKNLKQWEIDQVLYPAKDGLVACYHVLVYANLAEYYTYFVDASNGEIIDSYSNICRFHHEGKCGHAGHEHMPPDGPAQTTAVDLLGQNRLINTWEASNNFYMADGSRSMFQSNSSMPNDGVGVILTIDAFDTAPQNSNFSYDHFVSSNNNWSADPEAVSAHFNAGTAFEYFKNVHNRESISGIGGDILSFVNVAGEDGNSMGNAFWNGQAIFYGNGDAAFRPLGRALDVAGHEMTHGVVQTTANLDYVNESGAMNESFADIFGAMMDREDWKIGEDVVKTQVFDSGALRDMQDPHNGQSSQDYQGGWQPKHVNEQFTGSQDNGGVHINSGIPNHAYYLFATNSNVGRDKAEKVFYRALTTYLTRSSNFRDLRVAVTKSADDLYGSSVVDAANSAFDAVGIAGSGSQTNYEEDAGINPGLDLLLLSDNNKSALYIKDLASGNYIANPLSNTDHISRPSVSDDGSQIVFVSSDNNIHLITIDWNIPEAQEVIWDNQGIWRQVAISKDGRRVAALTVAQDNKLYVYDEVLQGGWKEFELYNPTFSQGVSTGDVLYADAMDFDISGDYIVYDANNQINSSNSGVISYWDIGFINVWNRSANNWAEGGITKLFTSLPEGVSVGNPSFSKNSPYILALDYISQGDYTILGVNLERSEAGEMFQNFELNWPNYSRDDQKMVYDLPSFFGAGDIGDLEVGADKISTITNSEGIIEAEGRWGVWFSNGQRNLNVDVIEIDAKEYQYDIFPNPTVDDLNISLELKEAARLKFEILDIQGRLIKNIYKSGQAGLNNWTLNTENIEEGQYLLKLNIGDLSFSKSFVKLRG